MLTTAPQPRSALAETVPDVPFWKMNGSGNDFVVIDNRDGIVRADVAPAFTRAVCRRGLGIGADGVILIETAREVDTHFHWRYLNADGSEGELCGNGAMCGARFALLHGIAPAACRFSTASGVVHAHVLDGVRVAIRLVDASPVRPDLLIDDERFDAVTIGVPHVVTVVEDADAIAGFHEWGRAIRHHPTLAPAGANVNAIHRVDGRTIRMRTWERGVEAETLACGTGAAASAIVAVPRGLVEAPVTVVTSSGRPIEVGFTMEGGRAVDIRITGEARIVATGQAHPEGYA